LFITIFLFSSEAQNSTDSPGDHRFFVGGDNVNSNPAIFRRDYVFANLVAFLIDLDSKKFQTIASPSADWGGMLSDTSTEDQCIQSSKRGSVSAYPFLDLVAEQGDGFGRPDILTFAGEEVANVG
jgi:hypothetical protein